MRRGTAHAEGELQQARDRLARFHSDPQRLDNERRLGLAKAIDVRREEVRYFRERNKLPPQVLPDEREVQSEQSPHSTPS